MIRIKVYAKHPDLTHSRYISEFSTFGDSYVAFGRSLEDSILNMLKGGDVEFKLPVSIVCLDYISRE